MTQHNRIFIVGHSGAGKGVLAKALAEKLGWQFMIAQFFRHFYQPRRTLAKSMRMALTLLSKV